MSRSRPPSESADFSRRDFLRSSAGLAGASLGVGVSAKESRTEISRPLRLGVLGLGKRGLQLLSCLDSQPGVEIRALADPDPQSLARARKIVGASQPASFRDLDGLLTLAGLGELDAAIIATPPEHHVDQAIACLEASLHVYLEKPLALTEAGALRLREAATRARTRVCQVGYQRRHSPRYRASVEAIHGGDLGEVSLIQTRWHTASHPARRRSWLADPRRSGGLLLEQVSHQFDLFNWIWDSTPRRALVAGARPSTRSFDDPGREHLAITLEYPRGLAQMSLVTGAIPDRRFGGIQELAHGEEVGLDLGQGLLFPKSGKPVSLVRGKGSDTDLALKAFLQAARRGGETGHATLDRAHQAARVAWLARAALESETGSASWDEVFGASGDLA